MTSAPWAAGRPTSVEGLVARVEDLRLVVDARLRRPAPWRDRPTPEPPTRAGLESRVRLAATFDRLAATWGGPPLSVERLCALHGALTGRPERGRNGSVDVAAALDRAHSSSGPAPLTAAALHRDLLLAAPFDRGNGPTARTATSALLMRAGFRSTLFTAVEQYDRGCPPPLDDEGGWLRWALDAMCGRSEPVAWFRQRELRLRAALDELGVEANEQSDVLVAWESGHRVPRRTAAALDGLGPAWHRLRPTLDLADGRLLDQLVRLRAEETDAPRPVRSVPASLDPMPRGEDPLSRHDEPMPPMSPVASVIIPAFRAADTITACLRGLQAQDVEERFDVIVVASGDDATPAIVRRAFPRVVVLEAKGRLSPGAGRNRGLDRARGREMVAFLAADCVPDPSWLRRRLDAHRAGHTLVGGLIDPAQPSTRAGWSQYFAKYWGLLALDGRCLDGRGPLFHLSYARWVLDEFGPFPEGTIAGEDTAYNHALLEAGHRVRFDSRIRARHLNSRRWVDVRRGLQEQGRATGALCHEHPVGRYYHQAATRPVLGSLGLTARAVATVARHRRDLLRPLIACLPLLVVALATRRAAFRRAYEGRVEAPAAADGEVREVVPAPAGRPAVSVVVAAYDEQAAVGPCLDSLLEQDLDGLEVILADDGSTDRTAAIATARGVPVLCMPRRGPARARNVGAAASNGDTVVFVDADLRLATDCVRRLAEPILAGDEVGTYCRDIGVANPGNRWAACWSLNRGVEPGAYMPPGIPDRWANFRAVDRRSFLAVGGYDDVGYGEDMTLAPKLGALATVAPGAQMWHHNPDSAREVWANARWIGRGVTIGRGRAVWRRFAPWRSLRRGMQGAFAARLPRYLAFRLVYDTGVLVGYVGARLRPRRHWK